MEGVSAFQELPKKYCDGASLVKKISAPLSSHPLYVKFHEIPLAVTTTDSKNHRSLVSEKILMAFQSQAAGQAAVVWKD